MKKIKSKYIRLTESELNNIIKESINKVILEYALHRGDYLKKCISLIPQIIQNWCLVHYCTIIGEDINQCKNHWKGELYTHIANISNDKIKKNNDYEHRFKTIYTAFETSECLTDEDICDEIAFKFQEENINIKNNEAFQQVCADCSNAIKDIVNIIALRDVQEIRNYIDTI